MAPSTAREGDQLCADALELMRHAIALALDPEYEPPALDPVSRYCPPELRWSYTGRDESTP